MDELLNRISQLEKENNDLSIHIKYINNQYSDYIQSFFKDKYKPLSYFINKKGINMDIGNFRCISHFNNKKIIKVPTIFSCHIITDLIVCE